MFHMDSSLTEVLINYTYPSEYMHDQTPATKLYVDKSSPHPPSLDNEQKNKKY